MPRAQALIPIPLELMAQEPPLLFFKGFVQVGSGHWNGYRGHESWFSDWLVMGENHVAVAILYSVDQICSNSVFVNMDIGCRRWLRRGGTTDRTSTAGATSSMSAAPTALCPQKQGCYLRFFRIQIGFYNLFSFAGDPEVCDQEHCGGRRRQGHLRGERMY